MTTAQSEKLNPAEINTPVDPEIEDMMAAGVHLGHSRSRRNPGMMPYLWGVRNNVEIIDLTKTKELLDHALAVLKQAAAAKKLVLLVGTRPSSRALVSDMAIQLGYPAVTERWIGGTLTNFKVVRKRVETMEGLEQERATGGFEKYTKKEQLEKEKEIARLNQNFNGLRRLTKMPDLMVIIDIAHDASALREARRMKIPVVALTDTNTDPRMVTYPIPANDDARPSLQYLLGRMRGAFAEGAEAARNQETAPTPSTPLGAGAAANGTASLDAAQGKPRV